MLTGKQVSIQTGDISEFRTFDDLYAAFEKQLNYTVETKIKVDNYLRYQYATKMAATFLSVVSGTAFRTAKTITTADLATIQTISSAQGSER